MIIFIFFFSIRQDLYDFRRRSYKRVGRYTYTLLLYTCTRVLRIGRTCVCYTYGYNNNIIIIRYVVVLK